jgi:TIR domain
MIKRKPLLVEMTGIFGAGFLPGLFKSLRSMLHDHFRWLDGNKLRKLRASYHIDDNKARQVDLQRRERIAELIKKAPNLNSNEWVEFKDSLEWADKIFEGNLKSYPCHILFRRGGRLQNWIHLRGTRWEEINLYRRTPNLPVFLKASYAAIKQTFTQNQNVRKLIEENPGVYCESAKRAFELQEEWYKKVEQYPGLISIERKQAKKEDSANEEFASVIISSIKKNLESHKLEIVPKRKVFISYSRKDSWFVNKLHETLKQKGIDVWIDKERNLVGDVWLEKIQEAISASQYFCLIVSPNSIVSEWVKHELKFAMNQEKNSGEIKILPLVIANVSETPSFLGSKHHIDFSKEEFDKCVDELMRRLIS